MCALFPSFFSGGDWTISGNRLDLHDPRILAMAAAQHRLLEDEYDEYTATNNNAAAFCRSIFLIVSFVVSKLERWSLLTSIILKSYYP